MSDEARRELPHDRHLCDEPRIDQIFRFLQVERVRRRPRYEDLTGRFNPKHNTGPLVRLAPRSERLCRMKLRCPRYSVAALLVSCKQFAAEKSEITSCVRRKKAFKRIDKDHIPAQRPSNMEAVHIPEHQKIRAQLLIRRRAAHQLLDRGVPAI
jgi:hypothetical protein